MRSNENEKKNDWKFQFIEFSPEFHWLIKVTATPSLSTVLDHCLLQKF
jgi:hypothetical protein